LKAIRNDRAASELNKIVEEEKDYDSDSSDSDGVDFETYRN